MCILGHAITYYYARKPVFVLYKNLIETLPIGLSGLPYNTSDLPTRRYVYK